MDDATLYLERLESCRDSLLSEVKKIESNRRWTDTTLLLEAVKEFKAELEKTEQGMQANKWMFLINDIHYLKDQSSKTLLKKQSLAVKDNNRYLN